MLYLCGMKKGSIKQIDTSIVNALIVEYKSGTSAQKVKAKFGIGDRVLKNILVSNNVHIRNTSEANRDNTVDEQYFEKIDTRDKAYFLGLIYADGHNNVKGGQIVLNLHEKDLEILEKYRESIGYTGKIGTWKRQAPRSNLRVVAIRSKKLSTDLEKLGCTQQKTLVLKYPYWMDYGLQMDFIRGFFDGDGSISRTGKYSVSVSFIAIKDMAEGIAWYLGKFIRKKVTVSKWTKGKYTIDDLRHVRITSKKDMKTIMDEWYKDTNTYIKRKHDIYKQVFYVEKLAEYELYTSNKYTGKNGGNSKPIIQYDMLDNKIAEWKSINEAKRAGYNDSYICVICKGKGKTHKGYKWSYK